MALDSNLNPPVEAIPPEAYFTVEQRQNAVSEILKEIALRIVKKRYEPHDQNIT